jgi:glycine/serine hydroxymethyltransferase
MMDTAMLNAENSQILEQVAHAVQDLCKNFPVKK